MLNCRQVDITIYQNWNKVKHTVQKIVNLQSHASAIETYGASTHYSIGNLGTISKHSLSNHWYRLASPVLNKTMPWLNELLDMTKILKPDDSCISYLQGPAAEHIDFPHMQTALNFIFDNTDENAFTWVKNDELYERYPSIINTAWILDTQKLHGISNVGQRWALSIHFNTDYKIVDQWFRQHPKLIFGKEKL